MLHLYAYLASSYLAVVLVQQAAEVVKKRDGMAKATPREGFLAALSIACLPWWLLSLAADKMFSRSIFPPFTKF
jgi:hypothetical protein